MCQNARDSWASGELSISLWCLLARGQGSMKPGSECWVQTGTLQEMPASFDLQSRKKKELVKLGAWHGPSLFSLPLRLCPSPQTVLSGGSRNRHQHRDRGEPFSLLGGARAQRVQNQNPLLFFSFLGSAHSCGSGWFSLGC